MHQIPSQLLVFVGSVIAFVSVAGYQLFNLASRLDTSAVKLSEYLEQPIAVLLGTITPAYVGTFVLYYFLHKSFNKKNTLKVQNPERNWISYVALGVVNLILLLVAVLVFVGGYGLSPNKSKDEFGAGSTTSYLSVRNQPCYLLINKDKAIKVNDELNGYAKVNYDSGLMVIYFEPGMSKEQIENFIDSNENNLLGECGITMNDTSIGAKK